MTTGGRARVLLPFCIVVTMARRRYTDEEKATFLAALDANDGNVKRTARDCGIPESTLRGWKKSRGTNDAVAELRPQKKGELADALEDIAWKIIGVLPDKIDEASVRELATLLGVALDKHQLLLGKPT